jgi:cytochrome c oxidase cbb3-type subunit I/II
MQVMSTLGVPYSDNDVSAASSILQLQQGQIVADLKANGVDANGNSELVALIAYLQRLGTHPKDPMAMSAGVQ